MNQPVTADLDRPFPAVPAPEHYLPIGPIDEAIRRLCRMISRGEALGVVMGPPGTGKTLLGQTLISLHCTTHQAVLLGETRFGTRAGLIRHLLHQLGRPARETDEDTLHLTLVDRLTSDTDQRRPLLLVIDEAQALSADLLDEVRMLTNLVRGGRPLVQTVLLGGPALEDALADPHLESFVQRIAARCYLHPLNLEETAFYIRESIKPIGIAVDEDAIRAVHFASAGIPRLINHLMDGAVELARARHANRVDHACVQIAWADSQQLPSPVLDAEIRPLPSTIEFGELDEETADLVHEVQDFERDDSASAACENASKTGWALQPEAEELESDLAAILKFGSIDCLTPSMDDSEFAAERPATAKGTDAGSIRISASSEPRRALDSDEAVAVVPPDHALFGDGFDDETAVSIDALGSVRMGSAKPHDFDPMNTERRLHAEIKRLRTVAATALRQESAESLSDADSVGERDDRELLILDEDVITRVEESHAGFIASGGMRKPPREVDQSYQDLFARLRGQR